MLRWKSSKGTNFQKSTLKRAPALGDNTHLKNTRLPTCTHTRVQMRCVQTSAVGQRALCISAAVTLGTRVWPECLTRSCRHFNTVTAREHFHHFHRNFVQPSLHNKDHEAAGNRGNRSGSHKQCASLKDEIKGHRLMKWDEGVFYCFSECLHFVWAAGRTSWSAGNHHTWLNRCQHSSHCQTSQRDALLRKKNK